MITISAPAKINLTLEVLGKRADGYHEVRSVLQTISLMDTLQFEEAYELIFQSPSPGWMAENSLVSRAANLLRETTGITKGANITIDKHIPLLSGLGGDSSDTAAVLLGLNGLWKLGLDFERLVPLARQLGSDVPFFLDGGTALVTGRGEEVTLLPLMPLRWVVLIIPPVTRMQGKTGLLYNSLTPEHYSDGRITRNMVKALESGLRFDSEMMFNTFDNIAFDIYPGLDITRQQMKKLGAPSIHLAGSGPALFSIFRDKKDAEDLYARLTSQRYESYLVETLSIG